MKCINENRMSGTCFKPLSLAGIFILFIVVACLPAVSDAGEIILKNGDKLTGKVGAIVDSKVDFTSDILGALKIDLAQIQTFTTDEAVKIVLQDGTVVNQKITGSPDGALVLSGGQIIKDQQIKISDITAVNPPLKQPPKWKGSVSIGWTSVHGNTVSESLQASVSATKRTEKDRTTAGLDYGKSKQENPDTGEETTTEDWWRARAKYDYFITDKLFSFVEGRYETDKIAELDRRTIGAGGLGYQWIEEDNMNFSTELGLAYVSEKFEDGTGNHETSAQAGYHFDVDITDKIEFINDLTYYPSFGQFSDYYLTTTAELRAALTDNMFASFKTIFDYDTSPARGQGSTDVKYILGVGWSF